MAERINWSSLRKKIIYGGPTYPWQNINLGKFVPRVDLNKTGETVKDIFHNPRPFLSSLRESAITGTKNSVINLNPIGRERIWYIGAGVGAAESLILIPLGLGWGKGILNMGAMRLVYAAADSNLFSEQDAKTFWKGVSAGGVYGSLGLNLLHEFFNAEGIPGAEAPVQNSTARATTEPQVPTKTPIAPTGTPIRPSASPTPEAPSPEPTPTILKPTPAPTAPAQPPAAQPGAGQGVSIEAKINQIESTETFNKAVRESVGSKVPTEDRIIGIVLKEQNLDGLTAAKIAAAKATIQNALENQANISYRQALKQLITDNPNIDLDSQATIDAAKGLGGKNYNEWFDNTNNQAKLAGIAQMTINEKLSVATAPASAVEAAIEAKVHQIEINPKLGTSIEASVSSKVPYESKLIDIALHEQAQSFKDLTKGQEIIAKQTLQNALTTQARLSYHQALEELVGSNLDLNTTAEQTISRARQVGEEKFNTWFTNPNNQARLAGIAQGAIDELQAQQNAFTSYVTSRPMVDYIVQKGDTAGSLIQKMGAIPTWKGTDWPAFAALRALNPTSFSDLQTATILTDTRFNDLIMLLQYGDEKTKEAAYEELLKYEGLIKYGTKIKLLTTAGMNYLFSK